MCAAPVLYTLSGEKSMIIHCQAGKALDATGVENL
jgi:hypothetical protein